MRLPQLPALPDAETRASTDGEAALATRERALHAVFRNDLALRRLLWRSALVAVLLVGWFLLTSAWSVYRDDEGVRRHAALNLAVGGPALAASGVLLIREWRRQAEVSRLLHAWLRMVDQPALRAVLARWRADPSTAIAPPGSAISPLTLFWMSLLRMAWRVVGAAAFFLAVILLASPLASSSDHLAETDPGGGDNLLVTVATMLFWGLVLLVAGWRALWKSLKRRYRAGRTD